jgi:hypothetical protein
VKTNSNGEFPLHLICSRDARRDGATVEAVELLINVFPQALTAANDGGCTPLHSACRFGAPLKIVRLLVGRGPEAVELRDNHRSTLLHLACIGGGSSATVRYLLHIWPVASLLIASCYSGRDQEHHPMLPSDCVVDRDGEEEVIDFMLGATKDTACVLIEYALCVHTSMPVVERDRLRDFITDLNIPGFDASASGVALTETICPRLTPDLVHDLVNDEELQQLLLADKDLQSLIDGLIRMNMAGRNYIQAEASNILQGIRVLDAISDNVDCLLVHLRENSSFFE